MPDIFVQKATAFIENSVLFRDESNSKTWDGVTYSVGSDINGEKLGCTGSPMNMTLYGKVTQAATDRVYIFGGELNPSSNYRFSMIAGAVVTVLRPRNGALVVIGEGTIIGGKIGHFDKVFAANQMVTGTSTQFAQLYTWYRKNVSYWAGVAAINAAGEEGPIAWGSFTPVTISDSGEATNTTSAYTATGSTGALAAPTNVAAAVNGTSDNVVDLSWDAVTDAVGYVVYLSAFDPATETPDDGDTIYVDLDTTGLDLQLDDLVVINKRIMKTTLDDFSSRRFGVGNTLTDLARNYLLLSDMQDGVDWEWYDCVTPPLEGAGRYAVRLNLAPGESRTFKKFVGSRRGFDFYITFETDKVYRQEIIHRSDAAGVEIDVDFLGAGGVYTPTSSWQKTTVDYTPATEYTGGATQGWEITVTAGANAASVDIFIATWDTSRPLGSIMPTDIPANSMLREHSKIKQGFQGYDIHSVTEPTGRGARYAGTLHTDYVINEEFNCNPWPQISLICGMEDFWRDIIAYMAAPTASGNEFAIKRNGPPFQDVFSKVRFECGNENWNTDGPFINLPENMVDEITSRVYKSDEIMGMWVTLIKSWMMSSPYWDLIADKIELTISGWFKTVSQKEWGINAIEFLPDESIVGIGPYANGWEDINSERVLETGESMIGLLAYAPPQQSNLFDLWQTKLLARNTDLGTSMKLSTYETGPGYKGIVGGTTDEEYVEEVCVNKSILAGATTLDTLVNSIKVGCLDWNTFAIGTQGSAQYRSHRSEKHGIQPRPDVAITNIIHAEMGGPGITAYPLSPVKEPSRFNEVYDENIKQIGGMWFKSSEVSGRWLLALLNRHMDRTVLDVADEYYDAEDTGIVSLALRTGFASVSGMRAYTFGIANPRHHNAFQPGYRPTALGASSTLVADPLCVDFDMSATSLTVPSDVSRIVIDDAVGASSGGLSGGNFLLLAFDGVTLAA